MSVISYLVTANIRTILIVPLGNYAVAQMCNFCLLTKQFLNKLDHFGSGHIPLLVTIRTVMFSLLASPSQDVFLLQPMP